MSCGTHENRELGSHLTHDEQSFIASLLSDSRVEESVSMTQPSYIEHMPVPIVHCDTCCCSFFPQSLDEIEDMGMGTNELAPVSESVATTMAFLEKTSGYATGAAASHPEAATADATPNVSLAEFLSRPVQIASFTWNEADAIGTTTTYSPWQLFFNTTAISNKLANYAWLRCDLKLKIMVNASPFYYGAMIASYLPLPNFKASTIINDAATRYFIPYSQRPHTWIYPQNNEGGEMTLPFFLFKNYISTLSNQDFLDMGTLSFINYTLLASANGATGTGVTVTIYAWAENVTVSGPSVGLLLQAKDEYGTGPVSSVASAVASAAKALTKIPLIKPYATATQMGAEGVAAIASKLGYCNTPVIEPTVPYRPTPLPVLASTEQGYPLEKLTIDSKNELSVDPQIVGLPPIDELNISHLVQKESYLCTATWASGDAVDKLLFQSAVTPVMFDINASTNPLLYCTPSAYVAQLFNFWRGDYIFRFRFIATQYHRGRVRIVFDPSGSSAQSISNTAGTQPVCFNEVIDLTKDTNVEIRIPYNQAFAWLKTFKPTSASQLPFTVSATPTFNHVAGTTNGSIVMRVVTALTGPIASASIPILVSVRGCENTEFANPSDVQQTYSQFAVQSKDEYEMTPSSMVIAGNAPSGEIDEKYLINHGEKVFSLRQLLRRYSLSTARYVAVASNPLNNQYDIFSRMPIYYGFDPAGQWSAKGLVVTGSNFNMNYVANTALGWVAGAFIGYRGSVNWSVNVDSGMGLTVGQMRIARKTASDSPGFGAQTTAAGTSSANTKVMIVDYNYGLTNAGGVCVTNQLTNASLNTSNPMYSQYKFLSLDKTEPTLTSWAIDDSHSCLLRCDISTSSSSTANYKIYKYCAIGTDWNCHFFINVPTYTVYSATPTPN